jgi:hypothetical protein
MNLSRLGVIELMISLSITLICCSTDLSLVFAVVVETVFLCRSLLLIGSLIVVTVLLYFGFALTMPTLLGLSVGVTTPELALSLVIGLNTLSDLNGFSGLLLPPCSSLLDLRRKFAVDLLPSRSFFYIKFPYILFPCLLYSLALRYLYLVISANRMVNHHL